MKLKLTVLLATFVVTMGLLLGTSAAQAATVITDDDGNVTRIENLEVIVFPTERTIWDVDFVDDTASGVYGTGFDFDFTIAADALAAVAAVNNALTSHDSPVLGAGPQGSDQFFIGYLKFAAKVYAAGGENIIAGAWGDCEDGCLGGARVMTPNGSFTWAKFTEAPGGGGVPVTIGGTVFGLESLLVLENNDNDWLITFDNGPFEFETPLTEGDSYNVSVLFNLPGETCIVVNGSGVADANVTDIFVVCGPAAEQVTIGGTVTGLEGSGILGSDLVLQNNGSDDLTITDNDEFTFDTPLTPGTSYNVTVLTNPTNPAQECFVARGSGSVPFEDVSNVAVLCAPSDDGPPLHEEDTVCTRELCAENEELQEQCETFLGTCLELEPENEDECVGGALLICGELF